MLDGYSRTILAGAIAPSEASWVALMVLYTACLRYGAPETLISDSGGAFTSDAFEAVCKRLQIQHTPIVSTQGESYKNLMETHFNIQRRLFDYQFSLTQTPTELEQVHRRFIQTYNTTAHEGLVKEGFVPPFRSRYWPKPKADCTAQMNSPASFRGRCSRGRPIAMAVSPCIATTSTL